MALRWDYAFERVKTFLIRHWNLTKVKNIFSLANLPKGRLKLVKDGTFITIDQ